MDYAVETFTLSKRFVYPRGLGDVLKGKAPRESLAVNNVSLGVHVSEILGLVGPNGAGKTTLINLLCTLVIPTAGVARVGGLDVVEDPAGVRRLVGLVTSNERSFYWRLTGRQNLRFFAELYRLPNGSIGPWISELLDALDLRPYADQRFDTYSTGIRQRLAIARALLHRPRILFMDEPTKGLDPNAAAALLQLMRDRIMEVWRPTIIVTSHNLHEIERLCHRIAIMRQGRILCCGSLDELQRSLIPHETYRLTVGKVPADSLAAIAGLGGVIEVQQVPENGYLQLELRLAGGKRALSAVLWSVLAKGGEIYRCSEVPISLEEVFRHIVSSTSER